MDEQFVDQVKKALELARKRKLADLGKLDKLTSLALVEKRLLSSPERSAIYYGGAIQRLIFEAIDEKKPPQLDDLDNPAGRLYLLLRNHIKRGESWGKVAGELGIERSSFYDLKRSAAEVIADVLWHWEEQTRIETKVRHNLPAPTFTQFIDRHNKNEFLQRPIIPQHDSTESLAELLIEDLPTRYRGIMLVGAGGVGKTALAYEIAQRCKNRALFDAVIWASAKKKMLVVHPPSFTLLPYSQPITSVEEILDTISHVLGDRRVSSPQASDLHSKLQIVNNLLRHRHCLIVIDNLEELSSQDRNQLKLFVLQYPGPSKVLLTSRRLVAFDETRNIDLPGMTREDARKFAMLKCEENYLKFPPEEQFDHLYKATRGLPLAIERILALRRTAGYTLPDSITAFREDGVVLDYLLNEAYQQLDVMERHLLHTIAFLGPSNSVSEELLLAASQMESWQVRSGVGKLYSLKLVSKPDSRYKLETLVFDFLRTQQMSAVNGTPMPDFMATACVNAADYYLKSLRDRPAPDQKLSFLGEGGGDEKWIILKVLQACRALTEHNFDLDGARPHDAWRKLVDLFMLISDPLGILWYHHERLRWATEAMTGCDILSQLREKAWIEVFDVGWTHLVLNQKEKAREIFERNLDLAHTEGYIELQALASYNLGRLAELEEDLERAAPFFRRSMELWEKGPSEYHHWIAYAKAALGRVKYTQGDLLQAKILLEKSLQLKKSIGRINEIVEGLSDTALVLARLDDVKEAFTRSDKALQLAKDINQPSLSLSYAFQRRAELNEILGRHGMALEAIHEAFTICNALGAEYYIKKMQPIKDRLERLYSDTEG